MLVTAGEIIGGFAIALIIGVLLAAAIVCVPFVERAVYPWLVVVQVIPKVALGPLLIIWLGFGVFPKVLIDADRRRLSSIHVEGMSYEEYVPEGWGGDAEDFYEVIPPEHRYWIDGGKDYLREAIVQQADEQARRESRREGG